MNAITVYVLAGVITRVFNVIKVTTTDGNTISVKAWIYNNLFASWLGNLNGSLAYAITFIIVMYLCMLILYKRKIFIKI
jgi:predicted acyltransferase